MYHIIKGVEHITIVEHYEGFIQNTFMIKFIG